MMRRLWWGESCSNADWTLMFLESSDWDDVPGVWNIGYRKFQSEDAETDMWVEDEGSLDIPKHWLVICCG